MRLAHAVAPQVQLGVREVALAAVNLGMGAGERGKGSRGHGWVRRRLGPRSGSKARWRLGSRHVAMQWAAPRPGSTQQRHACAEHGVRRGTLQGRNRAPAGGRAPAVAHLAAWGIVWLAQLPGFTRQQLQLRLASLRIARAVLAPAAVFRARVQGL